MQLEVMSYKLFVTLASFYASPFSMGLSYIVLFERNLYDDSMRIRPLLGK